MNSERYPYILHGYITISGTRQKGRPRKRLLDNVCWKTCQRMIDLSGDQVKSNQIRWCNLKAGLHNHTKYTVWPISAWRLRRQRQDIENIT